MDRRRAGLAISLGAVLCLSAPAVADQLYAVDGKDSFIVGSRDVRSAIVYSGKETLSSVPASGGTRFIVTVDYLRTDQGTQARAHARFVSLVKSSGEQHDEINGDPDYVSLLNQPFSIELDLPTMRDVARMTEPMPFSFVLPITGAPLNGWLRKTGDSYVAGERSLGIAFDAEGPVHGRLGNVGIALDGRIRLHGTAYYSYDTAILRALETRLTISGSLADDRSHRPVTITYWRSIRAIPANPAKDASRPLGRN